MHDFLLKYQSDIEFREFIDAIIDESSPLWQEYKMEKTYEILLASEDDIKGNPIQNKLFKFMIEPIDSIIEYFQSKEEYEKCNKLKQIKTYLL
jgi:glutathione peroxidase-family protein